MLDVYDWYTILFFTRMNSMQFVTQLIYILFEFKSLIKYKQSPVFMVSRFPSICLVKAQGVNLKITASVSKSKVSLLDTIFCLGPQHCSVFLSEAVQIRRLT